MKTIYVTSAINVNLQDGALLRLKAGANEIEDDRFEEVVGNWFVKAHLADGAPLPADHAAELAAKDAQITEMQEQIAALQAAVDAASAANSAGKKAKATAEQGA